MSVTDNDVRNGQRYPPVLAREGKGGGGGASILCPLIVKHNVKTQRWAPRHPPPTSPRGTRWHPPQRVPDAAAGTGGGVMGGRRTRPGRPRGQNKQECKTAKKYPTIAPFRSQNRPDSSAFEQSCARSDVATSLGITISTTDSDIRYG